MYTHIHPTVENLLPAHKNSSSDRDYVARAGFLLRNTTSTHSLSRPSRCPGRTPSHRPMRHRSRPRPRLPWQMSNHSRPRRHWTHRSRRQRLCQSRRRSTSRRRLATRCLWSVSSLSPRGRDTVPDTSLQRQRCSWDAGSLHRRA